MIKVGDVIETKFNGDCIVTKYVNCNHVEVFFPETKNTVKCSAYNARIGNVKDYLCPSVYGRGYLGIGPHKTIYNGKHNIAYAVWKHMLRRCYSKSWKEKHPSYIGCTVADRWLNFQNFCEDIKTLEGYEQWLDPSNKYQLDKDIKVPGNKVYGPDTCMFVSKLDNVLDANSRRFSKK